MAFVIILLLKIQIKKKRVLIRYYERFNLQHDRLERWLDARPWLVPSTCSYARSLIIEMITICEQLEQHEPDPSNQKWIAYLKDLLETPPSRFDPPEKGGSFVCINIKSWFNVVRLY